MSYDGRPVRATFGARAAAADRRTGILATAGLGLALTIAACGGSASSGGVAGATGTPLASTEASASAESSAAASPSGSGLNQGFLIFQEQNASRISGGGTITDLGDGSVAVTLGVVAVGFTDPMPTRIVSGSCADAASAPPPSFTPPSAEPSGGASAGASAAPSVAAPSIAASAEASAEASGATGSVAPSPATLPIDLKPAEGGGSNTIVQIGLSDLLSAPSSVLVYKSAAEPTLVACGDITNTLQLPSGAPAASAPAASAEASMEASLPAASGSTTP